MKLKKGDKVVVLTGKDKGKQGVIERLYTKQKTVLLPSLNMYKRHIPKSEQNPKGGIIDVPRPLNVAKVMLLCPKCNKPTRIGIKREEKKHFRICRKCKSVLS